MARQWLVVIGVLFLCNLGIEARANPETDSLRLPSLFQLHTAQQKLSSETEVKSAQEKRLEAILEAEDDLDLLVDYHPTVDHWTDRNNRIRLELPISWLFYSGELDVRHNIGFGLRLSWEAPGFIAIMFEGMISPYSRLEVKPGGSAFNPRSSRHADGFVANSYFSLALFNPELSNTDLALWAGIGGGAWFFEFEEDNVQNSNPQTDVNFRKVVPAGKVFFDMQYRIVDFVHVGVGLAIHVLYAKFTDDGRFYQVNNVGGAFGLGGAATQENRNDGTFGHFSVVTDLHFSVSIVF